MNYKFFAGFRLFQAIWAIGFSLILVSCSSFNYKTYDEKLNKDIDDPEPNYDITLNKDFQDYTNFMFIGNRVENFGTFFNTYYNAKENYDDAYEDYITRVLVSYGSRIDSVYATIPLSQQAIDLFNKSIEKTSRVLQFHRSSAFMDKAVLLVAKSYYYLGDYVKAERKFGEFASKLSASPLMDENLLFYSRTQIRLGNVSSAIEKLQTLIKTTKDNSVRAGAYQTLAEYYLSRKDYAASVDNFKKAIQYSNDSEFKAQMQFLIATVTSLTDNKQAAREFDKVLDFNPSFDLEFYSKLNRMNNLILAREFSTAEPMIDNLRVKYKEYPELEAQVDFLRGFYYEQKKDYKTALNDYYQVMRDYPKTSSSSNASYQVARYEENVKHDFLSAFKYYRYATEENIYGRNYAEATSRTKLFKKYYDLRSVIAGKTINTDYDSLFILQTKGVQQNNLEQEVPGNKGNGHDFGKPGGGGFRSSYYFLPADSLSNPEDSVKLAGIKVAKAKFELAELFDYEFKHPDSSEYYYKSAFEESDDYEFKSRVLFALSGLYKANGKNALADEIMKQIVTEYPHSPVTAEAKRLLNMAPDEITIDGSDSIFNAAEDRFNASDYSGALRNYKELLAIYPYSPHSIRCKYSAGWIYENILFQPDSAYMYYSFVTAQNPKSEYAAAISGKIKEYEEFKKISVVDTSGALVKDSVGVKDSIGVKDTIGVKDSTGIMNEVKKDELKNLNGEEIKKDPTKQEVPPQNPDLKKEDDTPTKKDGDQ